MSDPKEFCFLCVKCGFGFATRGGLASHQYTCLNPPFEKKCPNGCGHVSLSQSVLTAHLNYNCVLRPKPSTRSETVGKAIDAALEKRPASYYVDACKPF